MLDHFFGKTHQDSFLFGSLYQKKRKRGRENQQNDASRRDGDEVEKMRRKDPLESE
jgi:hypothetical protein